MPPDGGMMAKQVKKCNILSKGKSLILTDIGEIYKKNSTYFIVYFCRSMFGINDLLLLEDQREHYPVLEIRIKECKGRHYMFIITSM